MALSDTLNTFRISVNEINSFISLAFQTDVNGDLILPQNQRDFITDSAFLRLFIAWETFLEESYIKYMLGELSVNGNQVVRYVQPMDFNHANKLLIGTQKYVDWSNPEIIKRLSNLHFELSNPFDNFIGSLMTDLFDLKTIRNAAAHLSTTTRQQLDSLCTRKLRRPCINMRVSDFVFAIDPASTTSETIFDTYVRKLDISAEGIVSV
jgi:hypothetical protein